MPKIEFHRLYGENIGTYADGFDLRLDLPGFNLMLGKSGAGKSTLWRLLSLLCFAEIEGSNKQRSKTDLFHPVRSKKDAFGAVDLSIDGTPYTFMHTRGHNEYGTGVHLFKEGRRHSKYTKNETIDRIQEVLRLTYQQFTTGIYLPQRSSHMMVAGTSAERWRFVTELSGCSNLDGCIIRLRELLKEHSAVQGRIEELLASKESLEERRADLGDLRTLKALQAYTERQISKAELAVEGWQGVLYSIDRADAVESDRRELQQKIGERPQDPFSWKPAHIRQAVEAITERLEEWEEYHEVSSELRGLGKTVDLEVLKTRFAEVKTRGEKLRDEIAVANKERSRLKSGHGEVCHVCGQPWPSADRETALAELQEQVRAAQDELERLRAKGRDLKNQASRSKRRIELEEGLAKPGTPIGLLLRRLAVAELLLDRASTHHDSLRRYEQMIERLEAMPKVHRPDVPRKTATRKVNKAKAKVDHWRGKMTDVRVRLSTLETVEREVAAIDRRLAKAQEKLRKIELLQISIEAVTELKHRKVGAVTEALAEVAASHYPSVRETVSFGVDLGPRKFDISINRAEARSGKDYSISTRQLSGGEKDKAAIAFMFAIREIAAADVNSNLLVLDEAAAHMDDSSWDLLLERLAESAKGKTVFVMSHRTAAQSAPVWDRVFEVKKSKDMSRIERVR